MSAIPAAAAAARATRKDWIGLAIIALPCIVYAMDVTVLNLALPVLAAELQPSAAQLLWIIDIYGFMVAGFLITMGTVGDRIGRRKLLLIGAAAFGAASALAAFSRSAEMLIATRALLGIAGATLAPSTMSLIRNMFHDEQQRRFAIGVWIASFSLGAAIGPLVGGALIEWFHWGAVFLMAVPVMALLLLLGPWLLPEYCDPQAAPLDLWSVALSLAAVLGGIYGVKHVAEHGLSVLGLGSTATGLALAAVFVRRQRVLAYPLLDLQLFRRPLFSASIAAYSLSCLAMFGVYIFITQYLQLVQQLSPLRAGLATAPSALAFVAGSLAAPRLARSVPPVSVLVWGLALAALGFVLIAQADGNWGLAAVIGGVVVMSLGMAPVFTIGNELIITSAPPQRAGAASAIAETSSELSGALGIALFGSLGTWLYRDAMHGAAAAYSSGGAGNPALSTLAGTLALASGLPPPADALLAQAGRAALVDALQATAWVCTAIMVGSSLLAARVLRGHGISMQAAAGDCKNG